MKRKLVAAVRRTLWLQLLAEANGDCIACDRKLPVPREGRRWGHHERRICPGPGGRGQDPECAATSKELYAMVDRQARRIVAGLEPMPVVTRQQERAA